MQSIYLVSVSLLSQRPLIRGGKKKEEKYETRNRGKKEFGNSPTISLVKSHGVPCWFSHLLAKHTLMRHLVHM